MQHKIPADIIMKDSHSFCGLKYSSTFDSFGKSLSAVIQEVKGYSCHNFTEKNDFDKELPENSMLEPLLPKFCWND